jgi:hypothetical protein
VRLLESVPDVITPKRLRKFGKLLAGFFALTLPVYAGTVTGTRRLRTELQSRMQRSSFQLMQAGLAVGTGAVVPVSTPCYTSTDGTVVGIANPRIPPRFTVGIGIGTGTLPAGTYYAQMTAFGTDGSETLPTSEVVITLSSAGSITLTYLDPFPPGYTQGVKPTSARPLAVNRCRVRRLAASRSRRATT